MTDEQPPPGSMQEFGAEWASKMGALNERMGIQLLEWSPERVVGTMPVEGNTQPYGLLHGGASVVLAESLGSTGAALHAHPDRLAVGVDDRPPAGYQDQVDSYFKSLAGRKKQ